MIVPFALWVLAGSGLLALVSINAQPPVQHICASDGSLSLPREAGGRPGSYRIRTEVVGSPLADANTCLGWRERLRSPYTRATTTAATHKCQAGNLCALTAV